MSMRYLLDTNICIYIAKQQPQNVLEKFKHLKVGEVGMSTITYGELFYGACNSQQTEKSVRVLTELMHSVPVLPLPIEAGKHYGKIRKELNKLGMPVGNNDLWIAAHALCLNLILVSNNLKEFSRIPTLKLENWANVA